MFFNNVPNQAQNERKFDRGNTGPSLRDMPAELLEKICSHLSCKDIAMLRDTCTRLRVVCASFRTCAHPLELSYLYDIPFNLSSVVEPEARLHGYAGALNLYTPFAVADKVECHLFRALPDHPNVQQILKIDTDPVYCYGRVFAECSFKYNVRPSEVVPFVRDVMAGLAHIHKHRFTHRDVRLDSVLKMCNRLRDGRPVFKLRFPGFSVRNLKYTECSYKDPPPSYSYGDDIKKVAIMVRALFRSWKQSPGEKEEQVLRKMKRGLGSAESYLMYPDFLLLNKIDRPLRTLNYMCTLPDSCYIQDIEHSKTRNILK